jgi:hypothetical protein
MRSLEYINDGFWVRYDNECFGLTKERYMGRKLVLCFGSSALLSGCYFVNQPKFEASVHKQVSVGMPLQAAMAALGQRKMICSGENPVDCSRIRQSLMPYSCIERVNLYSSGTDRLVTEIQIPKIACAGL